jgi:HD-like signal output (HDOD) protein
LLQGLTRVTDTENKALILKSLPVFPAVAQAIIDSFNDPFATAQQIVGVVEHDPAIAARLVGLANSAYFSQQSSVGDLETAVIRVLGLDLTRGVALGMALNNITAEIDCPAFDCERFWRDSLTVALICQALARRTDKLTEAQQNLPYLAGLLSRIGLLALLMNAQERMTGVLGNEEDSLAVTLQKHDLPTHIEAATWLTKQWGLPDALSAALGQRQDEACLQDDALARILQCAVLCSEILADSEEDTAKLEALKKLLPDSRCDDYIEDLLAAPEVLQDAISQSLTAIA